MAAVAAVGIDLVQGLQRQIKELEERISKSLKPGEKEENKNRKGDDKKEEEMTLLLL